MTTKSKPERLQSLDMLRGFDMFWGPGAMFSLLPVPLAWSGTASTCSTGTKSFYGSENQTKVNYSPADQADAGVYSS